MFLFCMVEYVTPCETFDTTTYTTPCKWVENVEDYSMQRLSVLRSRKYIVATQARVGRQLHHSRVSRVNA